MPLPAGLDTVTVTIDAPLTPDGGLRRGSIRFVPSPKALVSATEDAVVAGPVTVTFDGVDDTAQVVELLATDAEGVLPTGWTYLVEERWSAAPFRTYSVALSMASANVNFADIAAISPSAGEVPEASAFGVELVTAADAAHARGVLELGTAAVADTTAFDAAGAAAAAQAASQPLDSDLTVIGGLVPANDDVLQRKAGAWTNRTPAQLKTDLALVKGDVGLGNVDNTSDVSKPISTATQSALDLKAPLASPSLTGTPTVPTATGGTNTTQAASTAFVIAQVALAVTGLLKLQGNLDCSGNPNYPAGVKGDLYYTSVAGKVGGASGKSVDVGDAIVCKVDNAGGTEASVGTSWFVLEHNLAGALLASNNLSDVTSASTARTNLGLVIGTNVQAWDTDLDTWATKTAPAGVAVGTTDTQTMTNKRVTRRVVAITNSATPAINTDNMDVATLDALNVAVTNFSTNLTGTPTDGQMLTLRIKDNGTARALASGASIVSRGATFPTTTVLGKWLYIGLLYNATAVVWDCVSVAQES